MRKIYYKYLLIFCALTVFSCQKESSVAESGGNVGTGGSMARFTIYGDYLYTVDHALLKTYSLANANLPELISSQNLGWDIETIYPYDGNLFIGSQNAMYIYSLENPSKPERKSVASHVRACDPVVAYGDFAYVTVRSGTSCGGFTNALLVYDVMNLSSPIQISTVSLTNPHGLAIKENTLYVCDGTAGLKIFDVSDPKSPASFTTRDGYTFKDCIVYNDILFCMVNGGMVIYDISSPNNPVFVEEIRSEDK